MRLSRECYMHIGNNMNWTIKTIPSFTVISRDLVDVQELPTTTNLLPRNVIVSNVYNHFN